MVEVWLDRVGFTLKRRETERDRERWLGGMQREREGEGRRENGERDGERGRAGRSGSLSFI